MELIPSPYHAPEVQSDNTPVTRQADIYSLGRVFVDIMFCACGIERTVDEFQKYKSKQVHNNFMNTGNLASNHHSRQPPFSKVILVLTRMIDWFPGHRPSAFLLKKELASILSEVPGIGDLISIEETLEYPDISNESVELWFTIM